MEPSLEEGRQEPREERMWLGIGLGQRDGEKLAVSEKLKRKHCQGLGIRSGGAGQGRASMTL